MKKSVGEELRRKMGLSAGTDGMKHFQMQYGHNGTHIVLNFGTPVDNLTINLDQCDQMIESLQACRKKFAEFLGKKNG